MTVLYDLQLTLNEGIVSGWDDNTIMHMQALLLLIAAGYWYVAHCTSCLRLLGS